MTVAFCSLMMRQALRMKSSGVRFRTGRNRDVARPEACRRWCPASACVSSASLPIRSYFTAEWIEALWPVVRLLHWNASPLLRASRVALVGLFAALNGVLQRADVQFLVQCLDAFPTSSAVSNWTVYAAFWLMRPQSSWNSFFSKLLFSGLIFALRPSSIRQLRVAEHAVDQLEDLVGVRLQFWRQAASFLPSWPRDSRRVISVLVVRVVVLERYR